MGDVSYIRAVSYEVLKWFFYKTVKNEYETMSLVFLDPFLEKKDKQVEPREDCVYDSKAETLYVETPFNLFFWYPSDESVRARNADNWLKRKLWDKGKASLNNSPFFFRFSSAVRVDVGIKSQ